MAKLIFCEPQTDNFAVFSRNLDAAYFEGEIYARVKIVEIFEKGLDFTLRAALYACRALCILQTFTSDLVAAPV